MVRIGYPIILVIVLAAAGGNAVDMLFLKGDGAGDRTRVNHFDASSRQENLPAGRGVSAPTATYFTWRNQCAAPAGGMPGFAFVPPYVESGFSGMGKLGRSWTASFADDPDAAAFFGGLDPPPEQSH
jgi:hypothetical protein